MAARRHTYRVLVGVCGAVVLARLSYARLPLRSDEGGYLFTARHWMPGAGEFLYGEHHVDRPPVLLGIYRLAALWETDAAVRFLTIPVVVVAVLALARAGYVLAGHVGARAVGLVAAALFCSPALGGEQADAGLFAASFVAISITLSLTAWSARSQSGAGLAGVAAGVLCGAAALTKQNYLEAAVFAGALVVTDMVQQRRLTRRHLVLGLTVPAGVLATYGVVAVWALSVGVDTRAMWSELVTFRGEALAVIGEANVQAPAERAGILLLMAVLSGLLPIASTWVGWMRRGLSKAAPEHWALSAVLAFGVVSLAAGGSYWRQYLLELAAPIALVAGVVIAGGGRRARHMRRLTQATAVSAVIGLVGLNVGYALVPHFSYPEHIGHWLADSADARDTVYVGYGHPHILESADLSTPYPYLWSLPMRTLDPHQDRLRSTLRGPDATTWVVQINPINSWDIDVDGRTRALLEDQYRPVAELCGFSVFLRRDLQRRLAPPPEC